MEALKSNFRKKNFLNFPLIYPLACLDATTCDECHKMALKTFKCNWCIPKDGGDKNHGGEDTDANNNKPFCSDQMGMHRRRQEWIEGFFFETDLLTMRNFFVNFQNFF